MSCGGPPRGRWCSGLLLWRESVDDDQSSTATRTGGCECSGLVIGAPGRIVSVMSWVRGFGSEQFPDFGDIGHAVAISEEAVVADAMLASWQHVDQEPADELGRCQRHGGVAAGAFDAVILDAEGDVIGLGPD